jgi:shikimate dehydrogenase
MPNKKAVLPLLDELSEEATLIGTVNVVSNQNGVLKGYNTDGIGLVRSLMQNNIPYENKHYVIAGAGGAGRAVAVQLALSGVKSLKIFDVIEESARETAIIINTKIAGCSAEAFAMNEDALIAAVNEAGTFVDCTPLGMAPLEDKSSINDFSKVSKDAIIVDICHTPLKSKLLTLAQQQGIRTLNWMDMVYQQGAAAFKIWTGQEMPLDYVREQMGI